MSVELFRSNDLLVRQVDGHGSTACVVTFASFTDFRFLDRLGFGEEFLGLSGLDAIHVISRDNDWYQYPETVDAMAVVHAATRRYGRVVTYGSSMGAYAAIRLAGLVGAHAVLALSPQYSIDPTVAPWDTRWVECSKRFHAVWERTLPLPAVPEAYVAFDPTDLDRRHIALFRAAFRFQPLALPRAGHPVTGFLVDVGLLKHAILDVAHGRFDAAAFTALALARREQSAQFLMTQSGRLPKRHRARKIAMLEQAMRLAPTNAAVVSQLGLELGRVGRFAEAGAMHRRSLELAPDHPNLQFHHSLSLEASGDIAAALAIMERLEVQCGDAAIYRPRLLSLRAKAAGEVPAASSGVVRRMLARLVAGRA